MTGSGKSWWAVKGDLEDGTYTFRVYGSAGGVTNRTEERTVEIDATPPEVLTAGQSADSVPAGDSIEVFAEWEDEHLSSAELWTNASEGFEWMRIPLKLVDGWSNWTIETGEDFAGKTFCWYIRANDTFGNENETETMCFRVEERLRIISFSPEAGNITVWDNGSVSFSIELNKGANVTWLVNGSGVLRESGTTSTYTNTSLIPGLWNVTAEARHGNERAEHSWILNVKTDTIPPALALIPPTPENGSLTGDSEITFSLTSNEPLSMAVLYMDGEEHRMEGSGKEWSVTLSVNDGVHEFYGAGWDMHGNFNRTGARTFEVDTKAPLYVSYGQSSDSVLEGENIEVYALWDEPHPETASLETNATENGEWRSVRTVEYSGWTNFTISTEGLKGLYCWRITARDSLEHENTTPDMCFRARERLEIISFSPENSEISSLDNESVLFSIELNQRANITWSINGSAVLSEEGQVSGYTNSSLIPGIWNVSVSAENENGGVHHWWILRVQKADRTPPALWFVKPTPENGSLAGDSLITFNLTSNENLSMAVLEIDGTNMSMMGSGKTWHLSLNLPDGRHGFRGYGKDLAGNMNSTGLRFFTVDSTPPEITVNAPSAVEMGTPANATIILDDAHPATYRVLENGKSLLSGNYSRGERFVLNLNTEKTGLLNYTVEANDTAGHISRLSFTVEIVDTTPPSISFTPPTPENGSLLNQSGVTFKISSSENLSIAILELDGMNYSMEGEGTDWSIALALNDGVHMFRAYGEDLHGNDNSTGVRSFEVDTEKPEIEVTAPDRVERGSEANVSVVITDRHPANYTILLKGEMVKTGNYSNANAIVLSLNTGSVGNLSYSIFAVDRAGNLAEKDFTVEVVDTTPPVIQLIPPTPENDSILNVSEVEFRINSSEELSGAILISNDSRFNGTVLEKANSHWSVSIALPDGSYTFRVEGWDVAGNPGFSEERSITVDTRAPSISFVEPTPENASLVGSCTMRITINASEELAEAILEFDGTSYTMTPSGGLWSYSGSLCSGDGLHSFRVYGRDLAGNWNSTEVRVIVVDSTPPRVIWVHPVNMTLTGENTYRAERLSRAWLLFNVTDAHPGSYSVFLNPKPHLIQSPIWSGEYSSGVPFGFLVKTKETGVNIYRISIRDAAGNSLPMDYAVNVSDKTPPGDVVNPVVRTDSSGFTLSWRNPSDDDFDHVELYLDPRITEGKKGEKTIDWADAFLANISGSPGHLMEYSKSTAHGNHVLYIRTVDSYGNRGNFTELRFNIPLPPFNLSYITPTPQNGSIVKPEKNGVTIKVQSSLALSSCVLTWNGEEMPMKVSGKTCSLSVPVIPGENYTFFVTAWDTYSRGKEMGRISFSVCGACFFKESSMEITSPVMNPMSLKFPVSFLFRTNTLARKYIYEVDVLGERITGEFNPTLNLLDVKELKGINVYTFNATFLLDLWGLRNKLVGVIKEGRPVEVGLHLAAIDACKKAIETERSFSVCGNAEEPKFWVELKNFYYGDEDVIIKAHYDNLTPVEAFYYSVNGGEWVKFNGTANLTGELMQGANKVKIKAITRCGLEGQQHHNLRQKRRLSR